jgi:aminopeptidase N
VCLHFRHEGVITGSDDRMDFAEPGVGPHYGPDRSVDVEHADVFLSFEPEARTWKGDARIRVKPLPGFDGTLKLDLDEVEVDGVDDLKGKPLSWKLDDGKLVVKGVSDAVVVHWHGKDPQRGLFFTGPNPVEPKRQHMAWTQCQDEDAHFLMPCLDHPGIKHPWTIELEGPGGYTLLGNGRLLEHGTRNGRSFAKFEQKEPMPAYLFTAVCAQLTMIEDKWRDKTVRYFVPKGEEAHAERSMGRTPEMMELFSAKTGFDFPWPRYDQVVVHDFIFGGMENTACTTMTRLLLTDDKAAVEWDPDALVSHELAHQWFGDLVTCQDWSQGWLNESWATFMEIVWWEATKGDAEAAWFRHDNAHQYFGEEGKYRRPIVSYDFREPIDVFDRHLYEKGACVLVTLRTVLGEAPFWAGVKRYLDRHQHTTVHTRHFQRALEEATGKNLDRFFQEWIHSPGHPILSVEMAHADGLLTVTVKQKQDGKDVPQAYALPLKLEIVGADGTKQALTLPVKERERTWAVPYAGDVATVRVDAGFNVLAKIELKAPRAWLEKLLADECPVLAVRAARALLDEASVLAVRAVVGAMSAHPFHHVRGTLAVLLGKRGGTDSRDWILDAMGDEKHPVAKRLMAEALGNFRDEVAAETLILVAEKQAATWHLQGSALQALGKTRDPRAVKVIEQHLDERSWGDVVAQRALDGLAETEDASVIDELIARTRDDQPSRVRAGAARALGKLGDRVEKVRDRAVERLIEMLTEPGFRAQLGAIDALATLRDPKALPALGRIHKTAPDGRTRRVAYEAMHQISHGRTGEEALSQLKKRVETLAEENHALRQRIEKLERPS